MAGSHDDFLLIRLREVGNSASAGKTWKGQELCKLADETSRQVAGHAGLYLQFMDGIRDLVSEKDDRILRRFLAQTLAAEPRLHADDQDIRDHLTHVTQVFLTGWIILNSCPVFRRYDPVYNWPQNKLFENLNLCWLYASLLHDCAYSVEYAKRALTHELSVRSLFEAYQLGRPGGTSSFDISEQAAPLWKERAKWRRSKFGRELCRFHEEQQYARPDHGIVGAIALWKEAKDLDREHSPLASILKPAALAIACHNFQYFVDKAGQISPEAADWFRLSLKTEPISVLLHICDELQEWGRERMDEAFIYKHVFKPVRYAATELTFLDVHDYDGLALDARLLRRLYPEHRSLRHRFIREQERRIAETSRRFEGLLEFRENKRDERRFHVRLRVRQTVDDTNCRQELRVDWPSPTPNVLKNLHTEWKTRYAVRRPERALLETVAIPKKNPVLQINAMKKGSILLPRSGNKLLRVIHAAGAAGKSTLLQEIADTFGGSVYYIEQLPDELTDIQAELTELANNPKKPPLLIVDHLDRLVEDQNSSYWLEQLSLASKIPGLHIILGSRTEEYRRYLQASLANFRELSWGETKPLLVSGISNAADSAGRIRAHAIESRILRPQRRQLMKIAALAADMGQRRSVTLPFKIAAKLATRTGDKPIVLSDHSGKARFLHDCVQDFFSAVHIIRSLSKQPVSPTEDANILRQLEQLPRDVLRFLFDLLASADQQLFDKRAKQNVASRLSCAFIDEPTIQQWLYDTGRLQQARYALKEYAEKHRKNNLAVQLVAFKFLGHSAYERFNPRVSSSREDLREAFSYWIKSARAADRLLKKTKVASPERHRYQWFLAFLVDHILLALTKAMGDVVRARSLKDIQPWIREKVRSKKVERNITVLERGWLMSLLQRFAFVRHGNFDELFCSVENALFRSELPETLASALEVRRAHLASHLGNYFLGEGQKNHPNPARLDRAREYFQRSIYLRERILRDMEREPMNLREDEVFSTLCQGYADNAHQYRGVFEYLFLSHKCCKELGELASLAVKLIEAHRQQEAKWAEARIYRGASERLPNMFRTSLPWLTTGRVLTDLVENPQQKGYSKKKTKEKLVKEANRLLEIYRQEGEVHARFPHDDSTGNSVFWGKERKEKHAEAVQMIARAAAQLLPRGTLRTKAVAKSPL